MGYLDRSGNYHEGDEQFGDVQYPAPPGQGYQPDGIGGWKLLPAPAPQSVTPLQARRALRQAGLIDQVNAAAVTSPETKDAWEFASSVERSSVFVSALATALGLTDDQVDDLFRSAATFVN